MGKRIKRCGYCKCNGCCGGPVVLPLIHVTKVPRERINAAWFFHSVRPGEIGSAIITAHYGYWKDGTATVFLRLDRLKKGDQILVEDTRGVVRTFIVQKLQSFDAEASVPEVFGSNDENRRLNLITCEGVWNEKTKSYPKRLIVFAAEQ